MTMKKILTALLVLFLCLGLCACAGGSAGDDPAQIAGKIDEFIADNQSTIDELNTQFADSVEYALETEGTDLVFLAKYLFDVDGESMSDSFGNSDTYVQLYERLKQRTGSDIVRLVVRVLNKDGETIHEEVVDENYTATEKEATDTLEDFVNSEDFQSSIASGSTDNVSISALAENGDTVVIVYKLAQKIDPAQYDAVKANYEEMFSDGAMEESFQSVYKLLSSVYPDIDLGINLRITDETDATIYEKALDLSAAE
ncbi:MAG: DUF4854 domain-containing protein [Firmicutes bacterium]|nr:DUF4854 domain-containing protein [Bacillota bacterium]